MEKLNEKKKKLLNKLNSFEDVGAMGLTELDYKKINEIYELVKECKISWYERAIADDLETAKKEARGIFFKSNSENRLLQYIFEMKKNFESL